MKSKKGKPAFISIFAIFFSAIIVSILTAMYVLLVKQLEIMNLDSTSFQAIYVADSAFECAIFKKQGKTPDQNLFLPANYTSFGYCAKTNDITWSQIPTVTGSRANSVLNISVQTDQDDFCGVLTVDEQVGDTSGFTSPPPPNTMFISGQNRNCTSPITKIIERLIEFYY